MKLTELIGRQWRPRRSSTGGPAAGVTRTPQKHSTAQGPRSMSHQSVLRATRAAFAAVLFFAATANVLLAENWPQWRGPANNGVSSETNLPTRWSKTEHVAWRLPLPGPAGATPVVWNDRIFLTSTDGEKLLLMCVGTDGKELWRKTVDTGNKNVRGDEGNSCSPSPVTDGEHVWIVMGTGTVACYDFDGN